MSRSVISYYELSAAFRGSIKVEGTAPPRFASVNRLRASGLLRMLREIAGLRAQCIIVAVEDEGSRQLAGPLIVLAAMTGSSEIGIMWPDRSFERISYPQVLGWVLRVCMAQISSRRAYWRAWWRVRGLQQDASPKLRRDGEVQRRVLYLDGNLPAGSVVGGSVGHTRGVVDGLIGNGFCVDYASSKTIPTDLAGARWFRIADIELLALPPELNCYRFNEVFDPSVARYASENEYAFIYQRMSVHNFTGAMLRRRSGLPLVLEYNGSEAWAAANWQRKLRRHDMAVSAERASLSNADLVVTVSDALAEEVAAAGVSRDRIVVYPNCIDPQIFCPERFSSEQTSQLRTSLGIPGGARVAAFIGTFGTWHGVDFLARAIRHLIETDLAWVVEQKLHFLLIGDGLKMAEVQALLGEMPFSQFVTLTGAVPQTAAPAYLAASDIFLCPHVPNADGSTFFGSPTKLFEYMAMERPIIASDLAQIGKVLRGQYFGEADGATAPLAALFTPGNQDEFLAVLHEVVQHPETASVMAAEARAAVLNSFTWQHHVRAILSRARALGIIA
ncbi:MAG: glycosyltransferase [bacterium]|nr:glycosyltransferase [bacterium]